MAYVGYRLSLPDAARVLDADPRPPVVYLRSFKDDASNNLNPRGPMAWLLGIVRPWGIWRWLTPLTNSNPLRLWKLVFGRAYDTSEEQLAHYFRDVGPFVAIGQPGERVARGGAYRLYLGDEWQEWVLKYLDEAQCVVIQASETPGLRWELQQVMSRVDRSKLVISLLSFHNHRRRSFRLDAVGFEQRRWDDFRQRMGGLFPVPLPAKPGKAQFIVFDADGTPRLIEPRYRSPWLWPFLGVAVDLPGMLGPVRRRMAGAPVASPLPRRLRLLEQAAAVASILIAIGGWNWWVRQSAKRELADVVQQLRELEGELRQALIDQYRDHPLHLAAATGDAAKVGALLAGGADVNAQGPLGETPLVVALDQQHEAVARRLLESGADATASDALGRPVLRAALHDAGLLQLLIDNGASVRFATGSDTPLHEAARYDSLYRDALEVLLRNECPVDLTDEAGQTPLHVAARAGNHRSVKMLLRYGADPTIRDNGSKSALDLCAPGDRTCRALLENPTKPRRDKVAVPTRPTAGSR